ncbi:MAG TPA: lipopolysaccharide heptosyltransferase I [Candidatus Eremiobacteraceae bacterium]|nr:lipopolysaccharide heptosyltransferase I [Candidatus Eremiobacteraceae bacterium]
MRVESASSETGRIDIASATTTIRRLLVVRLSAMGDVIHTLPAVNALRKAFPHSHIGWLVEERWAELLCAPGGARRGPRSSLRPLVDEVHIVNLKGWGKSLFSLSTLQRIAKIWNDVREVRYDVAVDLQGAIRSAALARWSRARMVYGSAEPRESPASLWYTRKALAQGRHVVEQNLSIAEAMIESQSRALRQVRLVAEDISFQIPRDPQVDASVGQRLERHGIGDFAILNPGAGWGAKRWPVERYGEVARALADWGVRSILNYGPGEEELARAAESASRGATEVMSCSLTELIALTRRARLFIGGDTGPLHLAAALRVPVVAIYGPTDPARNGPYGTHSIVLRSPESMTSHARRAAADAGMLAIGSDDVMAAANKLLEGDLRG